VLPLNSLKLNYDKKEIYFPNNYTYHQTTHCLP